MEGKYYVKKTPEGTSPKIYSEKAKARVDAEMRYDIDNGYNQRVSVLAMLARFSNQDFRYLESDRPGLIEEFKLLFPDAELSVDVIRALYTDYVTNERIIKLKKMNWVWEEVTFIEE